MAKKTSSLEQTTVQGIKIRRKPKPTIQKIKSKIDSQKTMLDVKDLSVYFGRGRKLIEAVRHASMNVHQGEIVGLVGESGSGKTTIGRAIMGLEEHTSGRIIVDDRQIPANPSKISRSLNLWMAENEQMIFQDPYSSLNPYKKVYSIIIEGMRNLKTFKGLSREIKAQKKEIKVQIKAYENSKNIGDLDEVWKTFSPVGKTFVDKIAELSKNLRTEKNQLKYLQKRYSAQLNENLIESQIKNLRRRIRMLRNEMSHRNEVLLRTQGQQLSAARQFYRNAELVDKSKKFARGHQDYAKMFTSIDKEVGELEKLRPALKEKRKSGKKDDYESFRDAYREKREKIVQKVEEVAKQTNDFDDFGFWDSYESYKRHMMVYQGFLRSRTKEYYRARIRAVQRELDDAQSKAKYTAEYLQNAKNLQQKNNEENSTAAFPKPDKTRFVLTRVSILQDQQNKVSGLEKELQREIGDFNSWKTQNTNALKSKISGEDVKKIVAKVESQLAELTKYQNENYSRKQVNKFAHDKAIEMLKSVGMNEEHMNRFAGDFSGGQRQRISIARAIIMDPKFIVADEPISALDVSIQAQVVNILKDLKEKLNLTILFIAHDLRMVRYISDRIYVIYKGVLREEATADELFENPLHPYTKSLLSAIPDINEVNKRLRAIKFEHEVTEYSIDDNPEWHSVNAKHRIFCTAQEFKKWCGKKA